MNRFADEETKEMGKKIVHIDAPGILGWASLCGHVDRNDYRWQDTRTKANCHACLAVVKHVKEQKL